MTIEIVDFPIEHDGSFHSFLYVYQRVLIMWDSLIHQTHQPSPSHHHLARQLRRILQGEGRGAAQGWRAGCNKKLDDVYYMINMYCIVYYRLLQYIRIY